uniref:G protein-coupled receptor n=1 Tax=Angiostrongylus cantonensis TaxID=6313 RepID=A0A158P8Q9_ANGCA
MDFKDILGYLQLSAEIQNLVFDIVCYVNIVMNILSFVITITFLYALYKPTALHVNLHRILSSLTISLILTTATKMLCDVQLLTNLRIIEENFPEISWQMCVLSAHELHVVESSVIGMCAASTSIAIIVISIVHHLNFKTWKKGRGVMQFAESYQVHENVITSRFINRVYISFAILFYLGAIFYTLSEIIEISGISALCHFASHIFTSLPTLVIALVIFKGEDRLLRRATRLLPKFPGFQKGKITVGTPPVLRDFEGTTINIENEAALYLRVLLLVGRDLRPTNLVHARIKRQFGGPWGGRWGGGWGRPFGGGWGRPWGGGWGRPFGGGWGRPWGGVWG